MLYLVLGEQVFALCINQDIQKHFGLNCYANFSNLTRQNVWIPLLYLIASTRDTNTNDIQNFPLIHFN
jgi:hypothetical protein